MSTSNRRKFIQALSGLGTLALSTQEGHGAARPTDVRAPDDRAQAALQMRENAAVFQCMHSPALQQNNGDEVSVSGYAACFTKGLPHDQQGMVDASAYGSLLRALATGRHSDFEQIERGSGMKLVNPQAAFTYELEGADPHRFACAPAPPLSSANAAAEMVELYWHALARDVPFSDYGISPVIAAAVQDLGKVSAYRGPLDAGTVSPSVIFRGPFAGCLTGPFISQFLWKPVPTLSTWADQKYRVPLPGTDFLTEYSEWLLLQSGLPPYLEYTFDSTPRHIRDGRGLAEWVHYDFLYQAFHNAALILLDNSPESILNTNPYYSPSNPYKTSKVQAGFATFGPAHVCGWLGRMTTAALEVAWAQKWLVHRRLRPEEFGGLVHQTVTRSAKYPIHGDLINAAALSAVYAMSGAYLLPQAYPEGCPLHPAYPAGHATVAGACSALLKAFFDENALLTNTVVASPDGNTLLPYTASALTVGAEINKLAWNIAIGRNFAGIHYRSDAMAGFQLGEDVAIAKMQDLVNTLTEDFEGFRFTRLDGTRVEITKQVQSS